MEGIMNSRERVHAVLGRKTPDRIPKFEVWIDGMFDELGVSDPYSAYPELGQDAILMPSQTPRESNAWKDGVDEFGRVWKKGMYFNGVVKSLDDLKQYTPPVSYADQFFDERKITQLRVRYPEHCLFFGTHIGPFMGTYMAMGLERMFVKYRKDPPLVHAVMETRAGMVPGDLSACGGTRRGSDRHGRRLSAPRRSDDLPANVARARSALSSSGGRRVICSCDLAHRRKS